MDWCDKTPRVLQWWSEEIAIPYYDPVQRSGVDIFPDFWVKVREANGTIKNHILLRSNLKDRSMVLNLKNVRQRNT